MNVPARNALYVKSRDDLQRFLTREHPPLVLADPKKEKRTKIWDISPVFHCSIIGTCLTAGELRQFFVRMRDPDASVATDHVLHSRGVQAAGQHDLAGKLLHKTIDARHETMIKRFAKASDAADIRTLWQKAFEQGDMLIGPFSRIQPRSVP